MYFDFYNLLVISIFFFIYYILFYNILLIWYLGYILDDQDLVDILQQSKGKFLEIINRVVQFEEIEKKFNLVRKRYLFVSLIEVF